MKILLLEDDPVLSDLIVDYLREYYSVEHAYSSSEAQRLMYESAYELYIFDINVPGKSGLELLHGLRDANDRTPVIIITAYQDIGHLQKGFENGCSDYLRKPFDLEELRVRVENIRQRFYPSELVQVCENIRFDPLRHTLIGKDGPSAITPKESEILRYLIAHPRRIVSSEELMHNVWEYENLPSDTTLRGYIKNLREILGKERIKTVRSQGYIFEP